MRGRSLLAVATILAPLAACGWSPSRPFERESPEVKQAIHELDAGDASAAASTLEDYLSTGACKEGAIGLPENVRRKASGSFDLGLALFSIGEAFGQRFGDEEIDAGENDPARQARAGEIACGLEIAQHVASDDTAPLDLRARARYLEGNLDFLGSDYEAAVKAYDETLRMAPGMNDAGDPVGRDAAWNRAIALRRIEDQKDAGNDAAPPDSGPQDGASGDSSSPDAGNDSGGDSGGQDSGGDSGNGAKDASSPQSPDAGSEGQDAAPPPQSQPDAGPPPPPRATQDDRVLDQLENAPTYQEDEAKRNAARRRRVRGMEDK